MLRKIVQSKLPQRAIALRYPSKRYIEQPTRALHFTGGNMSYNMYAANQQTLMVTRMLEEFLVSSEVHETQRGGLQRPPKISEGKVRLPWLLAGTPSTMPPAHVYISQVSPEIKHLCCHYQNLENDAKLEFLQAISQKCGVDHNSVLRVCKNIKQQQEKGEAALLQAEAKLQQALIPHYSRLFRQVSRTFDGVKFLMDLRADILEFLGESGGSGDHHLRALNQTLKEMLSHWFAAGLLNVEQITWHSSCDMLQKVSEYEAVVPMRSWLDLKQRVGPYRRCFVFTHSAMPTEPIVVLHTALTSQIPASLQDIIGDRLGRIDDTTEQTLSGTQVEEHKDDTQAAIFYSISSTQPGLKGVDLGNYLIKSVVDRLQRDFPHMNIFSSLSPIPGFKDWLMNEIVKNLRGSHMVYPLLTKHELETLREMAGKPDELPLQTLKRLLVTNDWLHSDKLVNFLKEPLLRLCARHLYVEKHRGLALNPVANFHLHNGATMWRINWLGDTSPRGMTQSCGMMANYRYFLEDTIKNSRTYTETRHIEASQEVLDLVAKSGFTVVEQSPGKTKSQL